MPEYCEILDLHLSEIDDFKDIYQIFLDEKTADKYGLFYFGKPIRVVIIKAKRTEFGKHPFYIGEHKENNSEFTLFYFHPKGKIENIRIKK